MSIKAMTWVWDSAPKKFKSTKLLVLLAIADHCNDDGFCYPGVKRLAHKARISHTRCQDIIRELKEDGVLAVSIQDGIKTAHGRTNLYILNGYRLSIGLPELVPLENDRGTESRTPPLRNLVPDGVRNLVPKPSGEPSGEPNTINPPIGEFVDEVPDDKDNISSDKSESAKPEPLSGDDFEEMRTIIQKRLNMRNGREMNIFHMLRGTVAKKNSVYYKHAQYFKDDPVTPQELNGMLDWYTKKYPDRDPIQKPETIASEMGNYRAFVEAQESKRSTPRTRKLF